MTLYTQFETALTPDEISKIPAGNYGMIDVHTASRALNTESSFRPRIYAYLERGESANQIVSIKSIYDLERYEGLIGFAWTSSNVVADLIGRS